MNKFTIYYLLFAVFFILSCKKEDITLPKGPDTSDYIFKASENNYAVFRTPGLVVSKQGTLLAFIQGRVDGQWDEGDIDIVLKRSTDGGKTWGPMQVLENDGRNPCKTGCPVVLDNGRILLLWLWNEYIGNDESQRTFRKIYVKYSDDDGLTWSESKEITDQVYRPNWGWYGLGPVHAIVKQREPNKGRIIIPARHELLKDKTSSHLLYSDDNGDTWNIGAISLSNQTTESTVVELSNGDLMLNSRNAASNLDKRYVNISKDGGLSFSESYLDPFLPYAGKCQASLVYHSVNSKTGKFNILFSGPNHHTERVQGTIFLSEDDGKTWGKKFMYSKLFPAFSGYSDIAVLENGDIAVFYETGLHYDKSDRYKGAAFNIIKFSDLK
jgi:sialidase-1